MAPTKRCACRPLGSALPRLSRRASRASNNSVATAPITSNASPRTCSFVGTSLGDDISIRLSAWGRPWYWLTGRSGPAHGANRMILPGRWHRRCDAGGMPEDFDAKCAALLGDLGDAVSLLRGVQENFWADWLEKDADRIKNGDREGVDHLLSAFGGMGSFNDLIISPANGHKVKD